MAEEWCKPVTLNPWQHSEIGYDTVYFNSQNSEYIKLSSPPIFAYIVERNLNLEQVDLGGFSERDYLEREGKLDGLYEETEKTVKDGVYRVYGAFEIPIWSQDLGKFGITENAEVTVNFNISTLSSNLDGSVLHMGDLVKIYDSIYGWKFYEVMNALPTGMMLGHYLMWQVTAVKTDLEGYKDFEHKEDLIHHDAKYDKSDDAGDTSKHDESQGSEPSSDERKPRPRVY